MSNLTHKDFAYFINNRTGSDIKNLLDGLDRCSLEFMQKVINDEVKKRDDLGRLKMLVVTDGFINHKFFNENDYENAVKLLKELKEKYIDEKINHHKSMVGNKLYIDDRLSIQTILVNADEVEDYLNH